jgi:hypothetical protein
LPIENFVNNIMSYKIKNRLFLLFFAVTTFYISGEMKNYMQSREIIAFEFIRTVGNVNELVNSEEWQAPGPGLTSKSDLLRQATRWDFLFILSYVFLLISLARNIMPAGSKLLKIVAMMAMIAGLSDVAENILLLQILNGSRGMFPAVMFGLATLKFGLIIVVIVMELLVAGGFKLVNR